MKYYNVLYPYFAIISLELTKNLEILNIYVKGYGYLFIFSLQTIIGVLTIGKLSIQLFKKLKNKHNELSSKE